MRYRFWPVALVLLFAGAAGCSSESPQQPGRKPVPSPSYLHPVKDLYRVQSGCEAGGEPGITFWLRNHAAHPMAYDIKYEFLDPKGKVVGSAEGVFSVAPHQLLGNEALYSSGGRCGPSFRLAYVHAYDSTGDGADQPHF